MAEHKDIKDDGQTVKIEERVITIHTNATDKATGEKMIIAGKEVRGKYIYGIETRYP